MGGGRNGGTVKIQAFSLNKKIEAVYLKCDGISFSFHMFHLTLAV